VLKDQQFKDVHWEKADLASQASANLVCLDLSFVGCPAAKDFNRTENAN
jgi:hypothetical protein